MEHVQQTAANTNADPKQGCACGSAHANPRHPDCPRCLSHETAHVKSKGIMGFIAALFSSPWKCDRCGHQWEEGDERLG